MAIFNIRCMTRHGCRRRLPRILTIIRIVPFLLGSVFVEEPTTGQETPSVMYVKSSIHDCPRDRTGPRLRATGSSLTHEAPRKPAEKIAGKRLN